MAAEFQDYMHKLQFIQEMPNLETLRTPERKLVILDYFMHGYLIPSQKYIHFIVISITLL